MDPAVGNCEIRIAARRLRDLLVRRHDKAFPPDLFASLREHAWIRPERTDAFQVAFVAKIVGTFGMHLVLWDAAASPSGEGVRTLEVVGTRPPSEVMTAAHSTGATHALRRLSDGAMTTIKPNHVVSRAGRPAGLEMTDVASLSRGGAS